MADALGDVIINLRSRDVNLKSGLDGVRNEITRLTDHVTSFSGILHIAFGASAARAIFHELHHVVMEAGESFVDAQQHGLSFGDSLASAAGKALGFKTRLDEVIEAEKALAKVSEQAAKARADANDVFFGAQGKEIPRTFSNLPNAGEADRVLVEMQNATGAAFDAAKSRLQEIKETQANNNFVATSPQAAAAKKFNEDRIKELQADPLVQEYEKQKNALDEYKNYLTKLNAEAGIQKFIANAKEGFSQTAKLADPIINAFNKTMVAFGKQTQKANEKKAAEDAKKADQDLDAFIAREQKKQDKADDILRDNDPLGKFKEQVTEIENLTKEGFLDRGDADKAEKRLIDGMAKQSRPEMRGVEQFANDLLTKSFGQDKNPVPTLKEILNTLNQIKANPQSGMVA